MIYLKKNRIMIDHAYHQYHPWFNDEAINGLGSSIGPSHRQSAGAVDYIHQKRIVHREPRRSWKAPGTCRERNIFFEKRSWNFAQNGGNGDLVSVLTYLTLSLWIKHIQGFARLTGRGQKNGLAPEISEGGSLWIQACWSITSLWTYFIY